MTGERAQLPGVVFVIFQTGSAANGGVESLTQVVERLSAVRPIVVTQLETPVTERWRRAGLEVHVWPLPYRMGSALRTGGPRAVARRLLSFARTNARMRRLVRATGARVVHCNDILALLHTAPGARSGGARVVQNVRDTLAAGERYGARWRFATCISDRTVVLSNAMRDEFARALGRPERWTGRIEVVYSVVDPERMKPASCQEREQLRAALGIEADEMAIGYVAGFNSKKAQLPFIERACEALKREVPGARVHFVGDFHPERDAYAAACRDAVRERGLHDVVRFEGFAGDVERWYRALDCVVLASTKEGLARCMIESLACGTPVVSFDVCSARETLEQGGCGTVVPMGDYGALVDAVARLARSPEMRREQGRRGVLLARERFAPAENVGRYEEIYRRLSGVDDGKEG